MQGLNRRLWMESHSQFTVHSSLEHGRIVSAPRARGALILKQQGRVSEHRDSHGVLMLLLLHQFHHPGDASSMLHKQIAHSAVYVAA